MEHVIIRIEEGQNEAEKSTSCLLLSGEEAESFIANPKGFLRDYGDDARIIASWIVPEELVNATSSLEGPMNGILEAILGLNALSDDPAASDLIATIFNAGFECGQNAQQAAK
jgi:hypothetical protein